MELLVVVDDLIDLEVVKWENHLKLPWSASIELAWSLFDDWKLNEVTLADLELRRQNGRWRCTLFVPSMQYEAWAETAPLAICLALLKAKGFHLG